VAKPVGRRGETRERMLHTALDLFCERGVGGSSLQMIADHLGVTKAAVYYQFHSKDDLVLAVFQPALNQLREVGESAEALADPDARREAAIDGLIDLVLDHRRLVTALYSDPVVSEIVRSHPDLTGMVERLHQLMVGPDPSPSRLIAVAMVGGGLVSVGTEPLLAGIDRDTLRRELRAATRRLLPD
jgi:AcrR family transcriptional regulator